MKIAIVYKFGPFKLNPASVRLYQDSEELEIEPQVFNTLLLLIENRNRLITKDELLEEIWQGRVVSDHVITRTIYELRKILDKQPRSESFIRTVRGKGYQFNAEVTSYKDDVNEHVVSTQKIQPNNNKKPLQLFVLMSALMVLVVIMLLNLSNINGPKISTTPERITYSKIAVLPIEVEEGNDELSMLVQSLIDYLTNQLSVNLNMKVIHPDSLVTMGDQLDDIWAIQKATGSDYIIQGFIEPGKKQSINLHLKLYEKDKAGAMNPISLGAFEFGYPGNSKELNDLYKQRKITVKSIIQIIKPGVKLSDSGDSETNNTEAYRMVIAAHHMARNDDCSGMQRAEQLLLKAIALDDQFVYAYRQLFTHYYKRVWICGESTEYHQKGLEMAAIVDQLAPNVYQAMMMRRSTILVESNQVEQAFEYSKNASWDDPNALYDKTYSLRYAGFLDMASQNIDRILQLDPFFFGQKPIEQSPNTLLYLNQFNSHLALLAEQGNSYHDYFRGLNLLLSNQTVQAEGVLKAVVNRTPEDFFGQFSQALLHVLANEHQLALDVIDEIVEQRIEKKHTDGEMTYKVVQLYALVGAEETALKHLQIAVDQGFFPVNYFLNDPALISIQDSAHFTDIITQASKRHIAFAQRFNLLPEINLEN